MRKKLYLGITIAVVSAIGVTAYAWHKSSASPPKNQLPATGQTITVTGTIGCLEPKNTDGPQESSCAIGLKQDDGKSYALSSPDPTTVGSLPTGQKVQIRGTFSQQSSKYDAIGLIKVTSLQRL